MLKLSGAQQGFILHWGEMGTRWGISRTAAQVHALLYIYERPVNAEEIAALLSVARLKELQNWGIIRRVPVLGDKRDHFECLPDVWEMFRIIADQKKKREVDPALELIKNCLKEATGNAEKESDLTVKRLKELEEFLTTTSGCYESLSQIPNEIMKELMKAGKLFNSSGGSKKASVKKSRTGKS